jgi:arsenate reductase (thioredoxin)
VANVLFVCVQNAGRSQMAETLVRRKASEHGARSAGTRPAEHVHPEVGVDVADVRPRLLERADAEWADVVVTMGCGDGCPYVPGTRLRGLGARGPIRPAARGCPGHA